MTRRAAAVLLGVASLGDLVGLAHQLTSSDRPPVVAMVVGGVLGVVGVAMVRPLLGGQRHARWIGLGSRALDVLLLGGAAASGHVFNEECAHAVPAVLQFTASLIAGVALVVMEGRLAYDLPEGAVR